jgi:hypothetical protein
MRKISIGQTVNALANIGVIAGIIFLAFEIRESTRATQAASIQAASALDQEHLLLVGSDPELARLWLTYRQAPESLSDDQRLQGHYLMAGLIRRLNNIFLQYQLGALSKASWESRQELLRNVARSPGYSSFLESPISPNSNQEFLSYMNSVKSGSP